MKLALLTAALGGILAVVTPNGAIFVVWVLFALFVALWASERPERPSSKGQPAGNLRRGRYRRFIVHTLRRFSMSGWKA